DVAVGGTDVAVGGTDVAVSVASEDSTVTSSEAHPSTKKINNEASKNLTTNQSFRNIFMRGTTNS
ncbi:MAG: hypothetical protein CL741_04900, partial [Chloroflexi bacterium]|nr:hypothetical protein [Chloroflexota bacterium]